jgi:hypothetical protein
LWPRVGDTGWEANLFPIEENKGNRNFPGSKTQRKSSFVQRLLRGAITLFPTKANEGNEVWDLSFLRYLLFRIQGQQKNI